MEQIQNLFRKGVLSHLEQLETLSRTLAEKQEQCRGQADVLQQKEATVLRLQKERDELRGMVRLQEEEIQALTAEKDGGSRAGQSTQEVLQEMRAAEMRSILEALWFTGISGKMTDNGVCFCISTAFEGTYLDSYYLQVDNLKNPRIGRHSIPAFIPLGDIAKTHLQPDMKKFLSVLFDYLNGYEGRKYQADRLQEAPATYISGTLQSNSLYTVLSFSYYAKADGGMSCFAAKLVYGDITRILPTEALITCSDNSASREDTMASHSALFCNKPLHRAAESLGS
ncbi:centromere protein O [Pseudophryne corroboree]|uniref:centromere protein O n=1 Tax=Pseudophryne corroboree TaxID=495146 RepID=UPI00308128D5